MSVFLIQEANKKRTKEDWIKLGVQYIQMKKKDPSLNIRKFSELYEINYNTVRKTFNKFKDEIKEAAQPKPPNRDKQFWIQKAIDFRTDQKKRTAKQFAQDLGLNYETFTRSMRKHRLEIEDALVAAKLKSKGKLTKKEQQLMMINDFRSSLRKITGLGKTKAEKRSQEWFNKVVKSSIKTHKPNKPTIGCLYTFAYDAKYKDILPVWDMFPMIVFLGTGVSKAGNMLMYGLNLHYIPPKARKEFLEELLKMYPSNKRFNSKTRLKIDWTKVKGMRGADLMIHSYLPGHMKGPMLEIHPRDWASSVFMPTQRFISQGKTTSAKKVWTKY